MDHVFNRVQPIVDITIPPQMDISVPIRVQASILLLRRLTFAKQSVQITE